MITCIVYVPVYEKGYHVEKIDLGRSKFLGTDRKVFRAPNGWALEIDSLYQSEEDAWMYINRNDWRAKKVNPDDALAVIAAGMRARGEQIWTA